MTLKPNMARSLLFSLQTCSSHKQPTKCSEAVCAKMCYLNWRELRQWWADGACFPEHEEGKPSLRSCSSHYGCEKWQPHPTSGPLLPLGLTCLGYRGQGHAVESSFLLDFSFQGEGSNDKEKKKDTRCYFFLAREKHSVDHLIRV